MSAGAEGSVRLSEACCSLIIVHFRSISTCHVHLTNVVIVVVLVDTHLSLDTIGTLTWLSFSCFVASV